MENERLYENLLTSDFYEVKEDANGKKVIISYGYFYREEGLYHKLEYNGTSGVELDPVVLGSEECDWYYDLTTSGVKQYITDLSEDEYKNAVDSLLKDFSTPLLMTSVTKDTPCGKYYDAMDGKLREMTFTLVCDRKITDSHYISMGGYEICVNGKSKIFDFVDSEWSITDNPNVMDVRVSGFDEDYSDSIRLSDFENAVFTDFFVFTGEYDDPEINPVKIKNLVLSFSDGLFSSERLTESANKVISNR